MLKHVPCESKKVEVMWKLIDNGLYIGARAHNYLVNYKNKHPDGENTIPKHCIFLLHTSVPTYRPIHPKPIKSTIGTYEYVLWDSMPAKNVWELAKTTLSNLQIPHTIRTWKDIFQILDDDYKDIIEDIKLIIKHNIILASIYSIYASYKSLTELEISGKLTNKDIYMYPIRTVNHFQFQLRNFIYLTPPLPGKS